jgi:hypothetical protein
MWWRSWLKHCDTSRKVASSILDVVVGIFYLHNPSCCTMALGSTQCLTEMSTRSIFLGRKGGRCVGLTPLPPLCVECLKIRESQPTGTLWVCSNRPVGGLVYQYKQHYPIPAYPYGTQIIFAFKWLVLKFQEIYGSFTWIDSSVTEKPFRRMSVTYFTTSTSISLNFFFFWPIGMLFHCH